MRILASFPDWEVVGAWLALVQCWFVGRDLRSCEATALVEAWMAGCVVPALAVVTAAAVVAYFVADSFVVVAVVVAYCVVESHS